MSPIQKKPRESKGEERSSAAKKRRRGREIIMAAAGKKPKEIKSAEKRPKEEEEDLFTGLPEELLSQILTRLTLLDQVRLAAVSTTLRSLLVARRYPTAHHSPWQMVFSADLSTWRFFSLPNRRAVSFELPRRYRQHHCCGSSKGWLAMLTPVYIMLSLLHPSSRRQIKIPKNNTIGLGSKVIFFSPPASEDCIVAAMTAYSILQFCSTGGKHWITIYLVFSNQFSFCRDIAFDPRGFLFAMDGASRFVKVFQIDSQLNH